MKYHHLILILFLASFDGLAFHPYSLKLHFNNKTQYSIVLQSITGDRFTDLDTLKKDGTYHFCEGSTVGMYRLIFSKTYYAKDFNGTDQAMDFIFNNEDIEFFRKHGIIDPAAKTEFNYKTKKYNQLQNVRTELINQIN